MNRSILTMVIVTTALISGCGLLPKASSGNDAKNKPVKAPMEVNSPANASPILQKIEFTTGVSSVIVERMASKNQCISQQGAGQITPKGPTEIYRVNCEDGRVFMAKCELRQCQPMMLK
jgi:hypothetical protein